MSISRKILEQYYSDVSSLAEYLPSIPGFFSDEDRPGYQEFVLNILVGSSQGRSSCPAHAMRIELTPWNMRELITKAHERLFQKSDKPNNVLCSGYSKGYGKDHDGHPCTVVANDVNRAVAALSGADWDVLRERIGTEIVLHLLIETSLFMGIGNDCYVQLTGPHLTKRLPARSREDEEKNESAPARKRRKLNAVGAGDIIFSRSRMFYSRPQYTGTRSGIAAGISSQDILGRLQTRPSIQNPHGKDDFSDPREQLKASQTLAKHIFPRMYGLHTVFHTQGFTSNQTYMMYLNRDKETSQKGSLKTPKRLKSVLPMLDKMIHMHSKCAYKPLLNVSCPSKVGKSDNNQLGNVIMENLSYDGPSAVSSSPFFQTQADTTMDSEHTKYSAHGLSQARRHRESKPKFSDFACSYVEVYRYLVLLTDEVIPKAFWGSDRNYKTILKWLNEFIRCRKYETLTLHHVLQGMSIGDCDWLMPPGQESRKRVDVSDALKRREILEEFIFWYFECFVLQILRTTFHVTDTGVAKNRILYFRHDDWQALCKPLIQKFGESTFKKLTQEEVNEMQKQNKKIGPAPVRFLPKEFGLRSIVNLSAKVNGRYSTNQILQTTFGILTYEKKQQSNLLGASVFGTSDIYERLKTYKQTLVQRFGGTKLPKLYFVKLDVQACFDTIDQLKLLEILDRVVSADTYSITRQTKLSKTTDSIKLAKAMVAYDDDDQPDFTTLAAELAASLRHAVFAEQPWKQTGRAEVLKILRQHISENIVKIGTSFYKQTVGIPQGSCLSTLLCSFFYGDMEQSFEKFTQDVCNLLMRQTDDYLFITPHLTLAKQFLRIMYQGHPEYGCFVGKDKTLTNFDFGEDVEGRLDEGVNEFPFSGLTISTDDLSVGIDYSRYGSLHLLDTLTVERSRRPGHVFQSKMLRMCRQRLHPSTLDPILNTHNMIVKNVYRHFILGAMRMHSYLRGVKSVKRDASTIYSTIRQVVGYVCAVVKSHSRAMTPCPIDLRLTQWLGYRAFQAVLSLKKAGNAGYVHVLRKLTCELRLEKFKAFPKDGEMRREMGGALEEMRRRVRY